MVLAMKYYTKMFHSILDSSVWNYDDQVRLVWVTMLMMTDSEGQVISTVLGLVNRSKVPRSSVVKALKLFSEPDPDSFHQEYEGRRIEEIEGGWRILNHAKYREMGSKYARRESVRMAVRRHREKKKFRFGQEGETEAEYKARTKPLKPGQSLKNKIQESIREEDHQKRMELIKNGKSVHLEEDEE